MTAISDTPETLAFTIAGPYVGRSYPFWFDLISWQCGVFLQRFPPLILPNILYIQFSTLSPSPSPFSSSLLRADCSLRGGVEMLDYITMCQLTILYSFCLRLASHLYSVDSPVCFFSSSIIIGFLISDFINSSVNTTWELRQMFVGFRTYLRQTRRARFWTKRQPEHMTFQTPTQ